MSKLRNNFSIPSLGFCALVASAGLAVHMNRQAEAPHGDEVTKSHYHAAQMAMNRNPCLKPLEAIDECLIYSVRQRRVADVHFYSVFASRNGASRALIEAVTEPDEAAAAAMASSLSGFASEAARRLALSRAVQYGVAPVVRKLLILGVSPDHLTEKDICWSRDLPGHQETIELLGERTTLNARCPSSQSPAVDTPHLP